MQKINFTSIDLKKLKKLMLADYFKKKIIFNFINSHGLYLLKHNKEFAKNMEKMKNNSLNFIDGSFISFFFFAKRLRGPEFTKFLLNDPELLKNKKHFFIGFGEKELNYISKKFKNLKRENIFGYVSEYTKTPRIKYHYKEDPKEINKIAKLINKQKINYLWLGVGNPRQEIMSSELFEKVKANYIINVGAAFDFISKKKKEAPKIWQKLGLEWAYRLITDFNYSKIKAFRSFIGTLYIPFSARIVKRY